MSDFWVSQQKHWCKYCKKYVYNNKATIQKHESGTAHKANVERFLSDVYRKGREDKKNAESVRRELERIEKAAMKSMGEASQPIVGMSSGANITSCASSVQVSTRTAPAPSTPNYRPTTTATAPGYQPLVPTLESLAAEADVQKLQGREEWALSKEVAMVGQWQTVETTTSSLYNSRGNSKSLKRKDTPAASDTPTHDQAAEFQDDDEEAPEDLNEFKIKEKEYPVDDNLSVTVDEHNSIQSQDDDEKKTTNGLFKKRKFGGSNGNLSSKKRTIRKKD